MFHIQTLNKISPVGLNKFDPANYTVDAPETTPDAIMVRSASMHDMEMPESLLAIARAGAGVNNIPVADCAQKGIVVFNTPGANANAVKELVLCGMLLASRKVTRAIDWCKTIKDEGDNVPKTVEKGKSAFAGPELKGKTLAVIGLGAIGRLVANAAVDLGNAVSIKHRLPMGAHDLDTIEDGLDVRLAQEGDTFIPFGSTEEEAPDTGEAVYACGHEIRTRRWTWRQSERGKITQETKAILFPIDGFSDVNAEEVHKATDELIDLLHRYFGDSIEIEVGYVSKEQPRFEFFK